MADLRLGDAGVKNELSLMLSRLRGGEQRLDILFRNIIDLDSMSAYEVAGYRNFVQAYQLAEGMGILVPGLNKAIIILLEELEAANVSFSDARRSSFDALTSLIGEIVDGNYSGSEAGSLRIVEQFGGDLVQGVVASTRSSLGLEE